MTDIKIAQKAPKRDIREIAESIGIGSGQLELFGEHKAKIGYSALPQASSQGAVGGKIVLVTAMTPTPAGEGKTTVSIGLTDGLRRIGKSAIVALREPSLGPVFGMKGGATGGGRAQLFPMDDVNLHFTGDLHAIGAANNLLSAIIDNHIQHGNALSIDAKRITWRRALDMNDRQLRRIVSGLGGVSNGCPREDGFDITTASEVMATLCLADDLMDLKRRLGDIVIGNKQGLGAPVTVGELRVAGAMAALLRDAIKPNLVSTLEGSPAIVHGGPFANIAHGCCSVIATRLARVRAQYAVTEAGFGADLGAEKFIDIKRRLSGLQPSAAVVVATVRALKHHGRVPKSELSRENPDAVRAGLPNLARHIRNIKEVFGIPAVVALNRFTSDTEAEIAEVADACAALGAPFAVCDAWARGGEGCADLARAVVRECERERPDADGAAKYAYPLDLDLEDKLNMLARRVYGADNAEFSAEARRQAVRIDAQGYGGLPVCVAKTQFSFSDNPRLLGAPTGFSLKVRDLKLCAGAGFVVAYAGEVMTMPGLPKKPCAENIDVDANGVITGLY